MNKYEAMIIFPESLKDIEEALGKVRAEIKKHGGELESVGHPTTTLEELFLRIVEESKSRPGRRYQAPVESR